ncbi:MAG: DUF423 domain-containing protein [Williamsia sp.]|nr:DUF423 domain-containing protein [Williamsia sp.]
MHKSFLLIAAVLGAISVALGAFGAHGLKKILPPESILTFETGVRYQFYHTFALLAVAILFDKVQGRFLLWSGYSFLAGIILFSGSLYALAFIQESGNVGLRKLGIITPFGGLFFIAGWLLLAAAVWKNNP